MDKDFYELADSRQKAVFTKAKDTFSLCFQVKKQNNWQKITAGNPLLRGSSFNLYPRTIRPSDSNLFLKGRQKAFDLSGKNFFYCWQAEIALLKNGWFRFEIELDLPCPLRLFQGIETEPQISFQLPTVSVQEEGGLIWHQVLVNNPVVNCTGIQSSDMPAVYYFDPQSQAEMMLFLDWQSFNWVSFENIFGFLGGQCGLKSILKRGPDQPVRERFLGFWPQNPHYLGTILPEGKQFFRFYFSCQMAEQPDEWQALRRLINRLTPLFDSQSQKKSPVHSWHSYSRHCLTELASQKKNQVFFKEQALGFRAFAQVKDFVSPNPPGRVELMTQVDLLWPLILWEKKNPDSEAGKLIGKLLKLLPGFWDSRANFLANWHPPANDLLSQDRETWYFLENGLIKFGWISQLTGNPSLKKIFLKFVQTMVELAEENRYLFPLSYDWRNRWAVGGGKNFVAGGLFAYGMWLAFKITGEKEYLTQAEAGLRTMRQLPLALLFHEPQQLGFAAAAAELLGSQKNEPEISSWAEEFLSQQLRMFYWYTDPGLLKAINCDSAGMVRSFPSKIYPVVKHNPAFKENVESILPWPLLMPQSKLTPLLLKFLNRIRINNFYYFDLFHQLKNPSFIPLEALPALSESGQRHQGGGVGHAIYGAGEVFWLDLFFETGIKADNPEILTFCPDYLHPELADSSDRQNFIVYNPANEKKSFSLKFNRLPSRASEIRAGRERLMIRKVSEPVSLEMRLDPGEYQYVTIS
ncbi:MAG: hypothetical protein JW991_01360 [Candidatus Pacebacteria bacterium]|nr:hypothetical protein [Candidatus Paceibacterota bacterium]